MISAHQIRGIRDDGKVDVHLIVRVSLIAVFFRNVRGQNRLASSLVRKAFLSDH